MWVLVFLALLQDSLRDGLLALDRSDLATARASLEAAASAQPKDPHPWAALAQTYRKLHEDQLAATAAAKAETLGASNAATLHSLALYYSETGALARAGGLESRYAELAPGDRGAIPRAVRFYLLAGQPKAAIEAIRKCPDWESRPDLRNLLGKAFALDGRIEDAAAELRAAVRLSPYDESYIFDLANLFLRLERFEDAIPVLVEGRRSFDKSPQIELALGVAYYGLRRFSGAIDQFLKTIALDAQIEQPYVFLGKMLNQADSRLPEITKRFTEYQQALPESYLGYLLHAKALRLDNADPAAIEPLLRKSVAIDPRQWETHFELGQLLENRGALPGAAAEIERAIELSPQDPTLHYRLARLYDRLGRPQEAQAERERHKALSAPAKLP